MQGQAESYLEKLHGMAERELADLLDRLKPQPGAQPAQQEGAPELTRPEFSKFREILIGLTDVTRTHFRKLVEVRCCPVAQLLCLQRTLDGFLSPGVRVLVLMRLRRAAAVRYHIHALASAGWFEKVTVQLCQECMTACHGEPCEAACCSAL